MLFIDRQGRCFKYFKNRVAIDAARFLLIHHPSFASFFFSLLLGFFFLKAPPTLSFNAPLFPNNLQTFPFGQMMADTFSYPLRKSFENLPRGEECMSRFWNRPAINKKDNAFYNHCLFCLYSLYHHLFPNIMKNNISGTHQTKLLSCNTFYERIAKHMLPFKFK